MKKAEKLAHYRLNKDQKKLVKDACEIKGVKAAAKARELMVEWAQETVAEHNILTGKK